MKKIYHLKTCDTCKRILNQLNLTGFEVQEIKSNPVNAEQLQKMYALTNSYEELFNKRARLYKEQGLKDKNLTEEDYKNYILSEYTFLKRPVAIIDNEIFVGNSKKTVEALIAKTQ
ncbi:arsenate reductase family protein [Wenyingzhuangia marina]|uniref:Arsenate reductase n=1 Tax=Wenyingzhuangia marina TaxID=1195760 RepID=A0A1M5SHP0_9FLAO|nr:ArsC/Spx/MgsR family protein [Wenyingzhuangia marina]GGF62318.1 arsenate reductase [Wenyingzhuangia marina]SHH38064.1 arsenate reductase [Wenyingzhuangia marina]